MMEGYYAQLNRFLNSESQDTKDMAHMIEMLLTATEKIDERFDHVEDMVAMLPIKDNWSLEKEVTALFRKQAPLIKRSEETKIFLRGFLCSSGLWAVLVIIIVKLLAGG